VPQMVQKLEMMTMKRRVISLSMVSLKDKFYTCISMILHRFIFRSFGFVNFFPFVLQYRISIGGVLRWQHETFDRSFKPFPVIERLFR
jgi:hypothetical protein